MVTRFFCKQMNTVNHRICFSNRKEVVLIDPRKVAYVEADGNYVRVTCSNGQHFHLNYSVGDFQEILLTNGCDYFIKIGRSLIVNMRFIIRVCPQKGSLLLSDGEGWNCQLDLPQKTLKRLCGQIADMFASDNKPSATNGKHAASDD